MSESALLMRFSFDHREAIDCLFGQFYSQIANDTRHFSWIAMSDHVFADHINFKVVLLFIKLLLSTQEAFFV